MGQGRPLSPRKRAAIEADLRDDTTDHGCNELAKRHKVSSSTVAKIAREIGHTFDRAKTENATRAKVLSNKARRAEIATAMLNAADQALIDMRSPYTVFGFGSGGEGMGYTHCTLELEKPPSADQRNFMIIAATAVDKSIAIDRHDNADAGEEAARSMLGLLGDMITQAATPATFPEPPDGT